MKRFNIKDRKILYIILTIVLICVFALTISYAALSAVLDIQGSAQVTSADWNIHFANPKVKNGSVSDGDVTISTPTTVVFSTTLDMPGDYYEFTIDVVNDGLIDAMIENVIKTPELSSEQAKYLKYEVSYENGEAITTKQLVTRNSLVRLKVRVEFRNDLVASDLPKTTEVLNLGLELDYIQSDDNGIGVSNSGLTNISTTGDINTIGTIVKIGTEQFYVIGTEGNNIKLLSMYNLYIGGEYNGNLLEYGSEATGMQDSSMLGYLAGQSTRRGVISFSSDTQKGANYSDYNGSLVEQYVNDYKNKLETNFGVNVISARLITYEEVTDPATFACSSDESVMCYNTPYKWLCSSAYWTGSAYDSSSIWFVNSTGGFTIHEYSYTAGLGVRPVIIMSKDYFSSNDESVISFTIEGAPYQARSDMTWAEWAESNFKTMVNNDKVLLSSNDKLIEYYFGNDASITPYAICSSDHSIVDPNSVIMPNETYYASLEIVSVPSVSNTLTYSGSSQSPTWSNFNSEKMVMGGSSSGVDAGTYSTTFSLNDGYIWNDSTATEKSVSWKIAKAAGSLSLSASSGTISGGIGKTKTFTVDRSGDGKITVSSSDTSVAKVSISGTTVTITATGTGTATITVSVAAGTNYNAPSKKTYSVTVTAYLVKAGTVNSTLTGGLASYAYVPSTSGSVTVAPTVSISSGVVSVVVDGDGNGTGGSYFTKSKIDLTEYNKMYITVTNSNIAAKTQGGNAYVRFGATLTRENKYTVALAKTISSQATDAITEKKTISLDISGLTGQHYLFINLYGAYDKSVKFTDWRLES